MENPPYLVGTEISSLYFSLHMQSPVAARMTFFLIFLLEVAVSGRCLEWFSWSTFSLLLNPLTNTDKVFSPTTIVLNPGFLSYGINLLAIAAPRDCVDCRPCE